MPTYHYRCSNCGHEFEVSQSIKDASLNTCPQCTQVTLDRVISGGGGMIFKGSGFYLTDYKNAPGTAGAAPAAKPAEPSAKPAEPSAKPAAPPSSDP
jgi:putative FmdB family regulatory protein